MFSPNRPSSHLIGVIAVVVVLLAVFAAARTGSATGLLQQTLARFAASQSGTLASVGKQLENQQSVTNDDPAQEENLVETALQTLADQTAASLSIAALRAGDYDDAQLVIEETLTPGSNYQRYIASYQSEGNKIYALLTIPNGTKPETGWPVVVFNHGYIPPDQYRTTERYIAYTDAFSRAGYIVLRSDYRGHGSSEGSASGGYGSNAYTIDVLNALGAIKKHPDADPRRIGMWGHSMGGFITLRSMVANKDIKAGVIWGGVVGSYEDLLYNWRRPNGTPSTPPPELATPGAQARRWRQMLLDRFGTPEQNRPFWNSISANAYLNDISGPVQLHHGTADSSVPVAFSQTLESQLKSAGKPVELYTYPGDDHDITTNFGDAMRRSVAFFDEHVKNAD